MPETTLTIDLDAIEGDAAIWQRRIYLELYRAPWTGLQLETMLELRTRIAADDGVYFLELLFDTLI